MENIFRKVTDQLTPSGGMRRLVLIRMMVGCVFFSEGIQKFLYPAIRGAGRFERIGLPFPDFLGLFVGSLEVFCGTLVILGVFTRRAVIPLIVIMVVAMVSTKLPILMTKGFFEAAHAARTDFAMLLGSCFLLISGAGSWSWDEKKN